MASTSTPDDDALKSLPGEGNQGRANQIVVEPTRDIDVAHAIVSMLRRRPEGNGREHQRLNAKVAQSPFGRRLREPLDKPSVEVDGEMRSLLLGTTRGNNRQAAGPRQPPDFEIGQIAEAHGTITAPGYADEP